MVHLTTFAGSTRFLQVVFSIIHLALNGKLTENVNGLSSLVSQLNSNGNSTLSLINSKTSNALSLATSGFTITSQPLLSSVKYFTTDIEHDFTDLKLARYGINLAQTSYLTGLSSTETSSVGLWFATFIYQTAQYGSWDCNDPENLITQYNLTGDVVSEGILDFLGIDDLDNEDSLSNATSSNELNELLEQIWNLTSTPINISKYNTTGELTKSELMIRLSQDCYIKKASIGVSFFLFSFFVITSGAVSYSFIQFRSALQRKLQTIDEEKSSECPEEGNEPVKHKKYRFRYSYANTFPKVQFDE